MDDVKNQFGVADFIVFFGLLKCIVNNVWEIN